KRSAGGGGDLRRKINVKLLQEAIKVTGPSGGNGGSAKGIFQAEVPADDPGHKLSQRGIAVGVCGYGDGDDVGKLRVAQSRKGARESCDDKAERHVRARSQGCGLSGERKDAGADDCSNAECNEV